MIDLKVFLDTAPLIYLLEDHPDFARRVDDYLTEADEAGAVFQTSVLSRMEFGVKPARAGNQDWERGIDRFLDGLRCVPVEISAATAAAAVHLRARYVGLKAIDGLQLATALALRADVFLTNDRQLRQISELRVVLVSDLA